MSATVILGVLMASAPEVESKTPETFICTVDISRRVGRIPPEIFGTNVEWFNHANDIWTDNEGLNESLVRLAKKQGIRVVRFPGGTLSDFYHWTDGIGPRHKRPVRPHHTDPGRSKNVFGTPELMEFCQRIGAEPLITVNVGTGTAEEAAAWVDYTNSAENKKRFADGFREPFHIKFWEIGNELYLAGSAAERSITLTATEYATRLKEYADKMKAMDPGVRIMAIGRAGAYNIPFGPYPDWNKIVLSRAHEKIDYISVHNAYFPVILETDGPAPKDVYQAMWGAAVAVDKDLSALERLISAHAHGRDIGIAVTEWGPFFSIHHIDYLDHVKTLGSAVYAARIFQVLLSHPKVKIANFFKFTDNTFMGWISYNGVPKVPYYAVEMYSKHFGHTLVKAGINSPKFDTRKIGFAKQQVGVPELTAVASIDATGRRLFVNIVSCSWDRPRKITLKTPGFVCTKNEAVVRMITGPRASSHNGPDLPDWWPLPYKEPLPEPTEPPIAIKTRIWDRRTPLTIPPHAVVMIELEQKD